MNWHVRLKIACLFLMLTPAWAHCAQSLQSMVASAKPGQTVALPEGEFVGGATLPEGVSLKGAGYGKTIIDASGCESGIVIKGGSGAVISDMTIRGASMANVRIDGAKDVTLQRVRSMESVQGFLLGNVSNGRLENCVSDRNSYGIAVSRGENCAVINCTVSNCSEIGVSLAASRNTVVFNNCIAGSAVCLNLDDPSSVRVDHNLYFGLYVGQMNGQLGKRVLAAWQYLTGLDAHSVQMPVDFKDAKGGDFEPTTILPWALDRAATSDWGTAEFNGVRAPEVDMLGNPRTDRPDVGAIEATFKPSRLADGQFTVSSDKGLKSAGVFTKDGMLIAYLFHNLPLPAGEYSFWLPARDYLGQPIPAGDYEVRLAQSDFTWTYLNHPGDNGEDTPAAHGASFNPKYVAFAPNGVLVMQQGQSEDHTGVRGYDPATGKVRWYMKGGPVAQGVAVGKDGIVYVLGGWNLAKNESRLTRLDSNTGKVLPFPGSNFGHSYVTLSRTARSLAALGDRLYVADPKEDKLWVLTMSDGKVEKALSVASPQYVAGDEKNNLLWVISDGRLLAVNPSGKVVSQFSSVVDPAAVAACDGRLAVASHKTGKVRFLDASNPSDLKPVRELGRGDGPFGPVLPDRFTFQKAGAWGITDPQRIEASVALDSSGRLGVVDAARVSMFDAKGKGLWYHMGVFGNATRPSYSTQNRRMWNTDGERSFLLNETNGSWKPEAWWDHSMVEALGTRESEPIPLGDFADGEKTFMVFQHRTPRGEKTFPQMTVARLDGFKSVPAMVVYSQDGQIVSREDTNGDGRITIEDAAKALVDEHGKPMRAIALYRAYLEPDGSISNMHAEATIWKRAGVSSSGVPVYEGRNLPLLNTDWRKDLSPYDFQPDYMNTKGQGGNGFVASGRLSDGGRVIQAWLRSSGASPGNSGAGTDLMGISPDGRRRWVHQLAQHKGIAGLGTVDDISVTGVSNSCEMLVFDADGLALGGFCMPPQLNYPGYWIDHPNVRVFKLPDGRIHLTIGNNADGRHEWFRLDNQGSLKRTSEPFSLGKDRASELAAMDWRPVPIATRPPQPTIRIPRLKKPLKIDGDLQKWRDAGISPVITMGPRGTIDGPGDCSGVIRMAYEGQNLYFQVLQFDDVPTFHQRDLMFCQNAVELALNGTFPNGFQFIVYQDPNNQDQIHRHRFMQGDIPAIKLRPEHAPRVVHVLDSAQDVTERRMLEALYGVDLAKAKVIVTEFMLPMDKETYAQAEADAIDLGPGKSFWIGFFLDDNDYPYTDAQEFTLWPSTFGMFSPKEEGAIAVCE